MRLRFICWASASVAILCAPPAAAAQQRPTAQEAEALLQARPDLAAQVRARLRDSGLTPDQIRARLRAEGYPETLLDAYIQPAGGAGADAEPSSNVLMALRALSVDTTPDDSLAPGGPGRSLGAVDRGRPPAITCDTVPASAPPAPGADSLPLDARATSGSGARVSCVAADGRPVAPPDSGRTIFGLDLFARATSQFDPNLAGPVDPSYRLSAGDQLVLLVTGEVELAHRLDVTREGFVFIPQVGQLHVANLTLQQVEDLLYGALGRVYPGIRRGANATTRFSLSVARLRSLQVFVAGDVARPGSYRVSSAGTALTALYVAGGPTPNGSLRRVEIRRRGQVVDVLDVYDYLLRGDASHDPRLETGDIVFVPVRGPSVRVVGEVNRPATYELRPGESLRDLVRAAGGFRPTAALTRIQIDRILPAEQRQGGGAARVTLDVSVRSASGTYEARAANGANGTHTVSAVNNVNGVNPGSAASGAAGSNGATDASGNGDLAPDAVQLALEDGDVVRVFPIPERVRNRIAVTGHVWQPGPQGYVPGLRLSEAIARAGGLRDDAYRGQVLVTRTLADSSRVQLRTALRTDGSAVDDVTLAPDDEIRIFSVAEFRPARWVAITGAVKESGRVSYRDGMTLRDLVLLAGGLDESAYLAEAEIARRPEDLSGAAARTIRVPLDSTYLFGAASAHVGAAAGDVALRPYDQVLILRKPGWSPPRTVVVTGEVRFPGRYALRERDERLHALLERAGGLTANADSAGIVFQRSSDSVGRIAIDLPRALHDARSADNVALQGGDSIHILPYSGIVTVTGAVNAPMAVAYVRGAKLDHYIRAAGGPTRRADPAHAYVTQASGRVETVRERRMWPDAVPTPGPGSRVVVPDRAPDDGNAWSRNLPVLASIVGSLVTLAAVLIR